MFVSLTSLEHHSLVQFCDLIATQFDGLHTETQRLYLHNYQYSSQKNKSLDDSFYTVFLEEVSQCLSHFLQNYLNSSHLPNEDKTWLEPLKNWLKWQYNHYNHQRLGFCQILELIKTVRQTYLDLLRLTDFTEGQLYQLQRMIDEVFETIELVLADEWDQLQRNYQLNQINQHTAQFQRQAQELQESSIQLQTIINSNTSGLLVVDNLGVVLFANSVAEALFGRPSQDLLGQVIGLPLVEGQSTEIEIIKPNNTLAIAHLRSTSIPWQGNTAHLISLTDVTENKRTDEKLQVLWRAIEQSPSTIVITNEKGIIEYVNPKFERLTGYTAEEVIGQNPRVLKSGKISEETYQNLWETITSGEEWHGELCNKKKNGEIFWEMASISPILNYEGQITHFVGIKEDITERKKQEERLTYQANYDALTQLPNRFLVFDRLKQAIKQANRSNTEIAVMFLDLDHFKDINDTLGHEIGDQLLIETAQRLSSCLRQSDTVARLGGDEFLMILGDLKDYQQAEIVAKKILEILAAPFYLGNEELFISTSIGITLYPDDGEEMEILLRNADTAMYGAKRDGRNRFKFFTASMNDNAQKRRKIDSHLRYALKHKEIYAVYQPLINLANQRIVGAEALMRWQNPKLGAVFPDQFIPIAEETGIITELGSWMLHQACQRVSEWRKYQPQMWVAVNLSPRQFRESHLTQIVQSAIYQNSLPTSALELELTERLLIEDTPVANQLITQLHGMEIRLSLDDFGTGYSSLSYLKKFPFSVLKIDKSFIADIPHDLEAVSLVKTIIAMAHSLNLKVIAEGIENKVQADFLSYHGCDYGQGYYFSRPVLAEHFTNFLT